MRIECSDSCFYDWMALYPSEKMGPFRNRFLPHQSCLLISKAPHTKKKNVETTIYDSQFFVPRTEVEKYPSS